MEINKLILRRVTNLLNYGCYGWEYKLNNADKK
jgi:hypothetical protein